MLPLNLTEVSNTPPPRWFTHISGFDNLLGGGIVKGSTMLIAGTPGSGKSTLLLQLAGQLADQGKKIIYVAGEENEEQIKMRAERFGINNPNIILFPCTQVERIIHAKFSFEPDLFIIDSLQMLYSETLHSQPGSPTQIRNGLLKLNEMAKTTGTTVIFIGQSTKGGFIAGLQTYQHTVDTVLYLGMDEDDPTGRCLVASKNRFGSVGQEWRVTMTEHGLVDLVKHTAPSSSWQNISLTTPQLNKILTGHPLWSFLVKMSLTWLSQQTPERQRYG